jgi:hypothetical protein
MEIAAAVRMGVASFISHDFSFIKMRSPPRGPRKSAQARAGLNLHVAISVAFDPQSAKKTMGWTYNKDEAFSRTGENHRK